MNVLKKPIIIGSTAVLILLAGGLYFYFSREPALQYEIVSAKRGNIVQEVSVIGRVRPSSDVDLAFEKSGRIAKISVKIGDKVSSGQELLTLDNSDILAQLAKAKANLASAEAKLDELKTGTRSEELQIAQIKYDNAKINLENVKSKAEVDLQNFYSGIKDVASDAYYKSDDAINKQIDEMFSNDQTTNPQLTFLTSNTQSETDSEWGRIIAGNELQKMKTTIDNLPQEQASLDKVLDDFKTSLGIINDFLISLSDAVNGSTGLSSTTLASYKGYVNTARSNINTAISNINTKQQNIVAQKAANQSNISSAQSSLSEAESNLALKKAGATSQQIASAEADVSAARANVADYENQLSKTILRSPIDGIVTKQDAKIGESVAANIQLVSVISAKQFEIETNVPEADIAKIKIGDAARVTLDAYGNDVVFEAKAISIEPAETIIEGVATYKTILQFLTEDGLIKSGMTANVDILSGRRENVIVIPQRAVSIKDGGRFVNIMQGEEIKEVQVQTGLKGSDGNIEIISGINEGDNIVKP